MTSHAWPKAVLFDLDGTLVDSVPDIHEALNEMMAMEGRSLFTVEDVGRMIGGGVPKLVDRAYDALGVALAPDDRERLVALYLSLYEPRATRLTRLNAGAEEILSHLTDRGLKVGVVTNKPGAATVEILRHFTLEDRLHVVVGGDSGPPVKPAPGLLLMAAERLGLDPADIVFVGDSDNDVDAAKAAGMTVVVVRGGYTIRPADALGAHAVIDRLDLLPHEFEGLGARVLAS